MADGLSGSSPVSDSQQRFRRLGAIASDRFSRPQAQDASERKRAVIGGFEKPRASTHRRLDVAAPVQAFAEQAYPDRGVAVRLRSRQEGVDMGEHRDASVRWFGWMQDLSSWMKEARANGDAGFSEQLWQSYARQFPRGEDLLLSGSEQIQWDRNLGAFFYANPVFHRVHDALTAVSRGRSAENPADRAQALERQLEQLKHQLRSLERASFRGFIPEAEEGITDLQRRLEQERGIELELRIRGEMAEKKGESVPSETRERVVSEHRRKRIGRDYAVEQARKEYQVASQHMSREVQHFRKSLADMQVPDAEVLTILREVSRGNFSPLKSVGNAWSRMKEGWRSGGLFRALGDAVRPSHSVLMERAQSFYEASQLVDHWQKEKEGYVAEDQRSLRESPLLT